MELEKVSGDTYVIRWPTNIGVHVTDGRATLIDAGNDEDAGRQILKLLNEQGWELEAIVCTHSNADHIGGAAFLRKRTGCRILATSEEAAFIEHPVLEPSFLYGGFPLPALRNKFLMAKPAGPVERIPAEGPIPGTAFTAMPLPGHYLGMIGVRTPDDVLFLGDSLFAEKIIEKYPMFFLYDIASHLETLDMLASTSAALFVPSHAEPRADISSLVDVNRRKVEGIVEVVERCCKERGTFEDVLERVCREFEITLDANQYVLVGSTVRSCLSYLVTQGRVEMLFEAGKVLWLAQA